METEISNNFRAALRTAFAQAGLTLDEGRLALLAKALATVRDVSATLAAIDYGETEPARRFRPTAGSRES